MNNQSIKCDVCSCMHHQGNKGCKLSSITVTNTTDCTTAHYCQDYCTEKEC